MRNSHSGNFVPFPRGSLAMSVDMFGCHDWSDRCQWHLVHKGQESCSTLQCTGQPPLPLPLCTQRHIWPEISISWGWKNPAVDNQGNSGKINWNFIKLCEFLSASDGYIIYIIISVLLWDLNHLTFRDVRVTKCSFFIIFKIYWHFEKNTIIPSCDFCPHISIIIIFKQQIMLQTAVSKPECVIHSFAV